MNLSALKNGDTDYVLTPLQMKIALYPFSLNFEANRACFPFIHEGKPVVSIGKNPAPSCILSHRTAGDMVFRMPNKNREHFFNSIGIPAEKVYSLYQIHSHDVFILGDSEPDHLRCKGSGEGSSLDIVNPLPLPEVFAQKGDGMVSFTPSVFLAITAADCLPIFLLDTEKGYFSVLHSGWKGTGIVLKAIEIMQNADSRPEAITAVLGPCIQSCCYKVDEERAKYFETEFGPASSNNNIAEYPLGDVIRQENADWFINLQAANARLLAAAGIRHIAYCTDCTYTDTRLGSYRREGAESFTRMIAMAGTQSALCRH